MYACTRKKGEFFMKRFLITLLFVLSLSLCSTYALADTLPDMPPPDQICFEPISRVEWINRLRSDDEFTFLKVSNEFSALSSTDLQVKASTEVNQTAGMLGGMIYVERWENNTWKTYSSTGFSAGNSKKASTTRTLTVEPGYYYRTRVLHDATKSPQTITMTTYTKSKLF